MTSVPDPAGDMDDDLSGISPELVLVDPELARRLREREPAPPPQLWLVPPRAEPEPQAPESVDVDHLPEAAEADLESVDDGAHTIVDAQDEALPHAESSDAPEPALPVSNDPWVADEPETVDAMPLADELGSPDAEPGLPGDLSLPVPGIERPVDEPEPIVLSALAEPLVLPEADDLILPRHVDDTATHEVEPPASVPTVDLEVQEPVEPPTDHVVAEAAITPPVEARTSYDEQLAPISVEAAPIAVEPPPVAFEEAPVRSLPVRPGPTEVAPPPLPPVRRRRRRGRRLLLLVVLVVLVGLAAGAVLGFMSRSNDAGTGSSTPPAAAPSPTNGGAGNGSSAPSGNAQNGNGSTAGPTVTPGAKPKSRSAKPHATSPSRATKKPAPKKTAAKKPSTSASKPKATPKPKTAAPAETRRFAWAPVDGALSYHVELFRGADRILARDTTQPVLELGTTWRYEGKVVRLTPGSYRWYVWPVTKSGRAVQAVVQAKLDIP